MYTGMWFSTITQQIWNCDPWDWDEKDSPHPVLVTELPSLDNGGISEDGKTITLKLRDDIVWSDGTPITSDDFVFTHAMFTDPGNAVNSTYPYDQFEVEAPDDRTVVITFAEPVCALDVLDLTEILPAHVLRPVFEAEGTLDEAEWNYAPTVGCGPYVFSEWETGSYASFVKNENYYNDPAKIDEIFIRFVPDDASQIAALRTGEGDLGPFSPTRTFPCWKKRALRSSWPPAGIMRVGTFTLARRAIPPSRTCGCARPSPCAMTASPSSTTSCWARPRWRPASGTTPPGRMPALNPGPTIRTGPTPCWTRPAGWTATATACATRTVRS